MRVSFDIDGTLVCAPSVPTEKVVPWWGRWWYPEPLRRGTQEWMRALVEQQHQLWVYTTSDRSPRYLRGWFRSIGVPIFGVVNRLRHQRVVGPQGPSKYPPAFGIDLHVDDSVGVGMEGETHRFRVVVISPSDLEWVSRVLEAVQGYPVR